MTFLIVPHAVGIREYHIIFPPKSLAASNSLAMKTSMLATPLMDQMTPLGIRFPAIIMTSMFVMSSLQFLHSVLFLQSVSLTNRCNIGDDNNHLLLGTNSFVQMQQQSNSNSIENDQLSILANAWKLYFHQPDLSESSPKQTYADVIPRRNQKQQSLDDITLATHLTTNKFDRFLIQQKRWDGPCSAAVYINNETQIDDFVTFYHNHRLELEKVSFHVLLEPPTVEGGYPHNLLRNLALDHITTDFFLAIDVDFVTPVNCNRQLLDLMDVDSTIRDRLRSRTLFVLPAFERFIQYSDQPLPANKEELLPLVNKTVAPFHINNFFRGHGPTNFTRWINNKGRSNYYLIKYEKGFEPYVIGYRASAPRYWPRFRGFGFNKLSWIMEANYMGHTFAVLKPMFVLHQNHVIEGKVFNNFANHGMGSFGEYLVSTYSVPWLELKREFGSRINHTPEFQERMDKRLNKKIEAVHDRFKIMQDEYVDYIKGRRKWKRLITLMDTIDKTYVASYDERRSFLEEVQEHLAYLDARILRAMKKEGLIAK